MGILAMTPLLSLTLGSMTWHFKIGSSRMDISFLAFMLTWIVWFCELRSYILGNSPLAGCNERYFSTSRDSGVVASVKKLLVKKFFNYTGNILALFIIDNLAILLESDWVFSFISQCTLKFRLDANSDITKLEAAIVSFGQVYLECNVVRFSGHCYCVVFDKA